MCCKDRLAARKLFRRETAAAEADPLLAVATKIRDLRRELVTVHRSGPKLG